jgi:hypothetical protein
MMFWAEVNWALVQLKFFMDRYTIPYRYENIRY